MSDEKIMPKVGDPVVKLSFNWQGYTDYRETSAVAKIYKNGNVVLAGSNKQYVVHPYSEDYRLSECSGNATWALITDKVKADIEKSKQISRLFSGKHKLDDFFKNNRRHIASLSHDDIILMNNAVENLLQLVEKAST